MAEQRQTLTVEEVSEILGVSRNSGYALMADESRGFPAFRLGRRYIIPQTPFFRWLNSSEDSDETA